MMHERIQGWIHALEVGVFARWLIVLPVAVVMLGLIVLYDVRAYRSFSSPEAMDAAQVARNLAEGRGYTTDFIRPFSIYLVQKHNRAAASDGALATNVSGLCGTQRRRTRISPMRRRIRPLLAGLWKIW